jgi:hypothetical protein
MSWKVLKISEVIENVQENSILQLDAVAALRKT